MANNEPQTELIEELNDRARNIEKLLDIAIFKAQGIQLENEKARQDRDNIVAFLNGAMAMATQTKEITYKYLETTLFKDK